MLEIRKLTIEVDQKELLHELNLNVNQNDKLAIIGEEGNGKSTLLKYLYDEKLVPYAKITGSVLKKGTLGYLPQTLTEEEQNQKGETFLLSSNCSFLSKQTYHYLNEFRLDPSILKRTMKTLSGGEKVKMSLLRLLLENPDILLLDEPSNDLDIETLTWLEEWIEKETRPILFISHDETLLSRTANRILHIELVQKKQVARHTVMNEGYEDYIENRNRKLLHETEIAKKEKQNYQKKEQKLNQVMQKVAYQQATITRKDPHGGYLLKRKMKSLKSQERKLNKTELTKIPDVEEAIHFFFDEVSIPAKKEILSLQLSPLQIENHKLSEQISLEIRGRQHIVIVGPNGAGKTTLLKEIANRLLPRKGIKVGYMPQHYEDLLPPTLTPLDFLNATGNKEKLAQVRSYLGNMNFTKEEMTGPIARLSGGSKAKLLLIHLILDHCEILLLDEPTRNLSPLSNPIVRTVLKNFTGTIISTSHDRKYIKEVGEIIYRLTPEGLMEQTEKF